MTSRATPSWEGAAPAPERLPRSRKWRVCTESAAGSGCPETEALAELARQPPTAMSSFDTNPFADPVDVNPFQVEAPTQFSLVPKAAAPASFAGAGRRGVGETGCLPNGRMGSEGWPIVVFGGRD